MYSISRHQYTYFTNKLLYRVYLLKLFIQVLFNFSNAKPGMRCFPYLRVATVLTFDLLFIYKYARSYSPHL